MHAILAKAGPQRREMLAEELTQMGLVIFSLRRQPRTPHLQRAILCNARSRFGMTGPFSHAAALPHRLPRTYLRVQLTQTH